MVVPKTTYLWHWCNEWIEPGDASKKFDWRIWINQSQLTLFESYSQWYHWKTSQSVSMKLKTPALTNSSSLDKQLFTWQTALHLTMTSAQVFVTPYNVNNSSLFWNYFYLFLTGRSHHRVDFYSEWKYSLHSLIHSFILPVEPKPADSTHCAKPVLSYIGNPEPSVFNCEFSGYPPPDVRILKDGQVLAYGEDSLSYSVSVDSVDDFGEYVCMAENEVGKSKKNYTFEIRSSGNEYGNTIRPFKSS